MNGISVIICCYNSEARISDSLTYLASLASPPDVPWEVVLVDNASTDNTKSCAQNTWTSLRTNVPLLFVDEPKQGLSYARMKGLAVASFDTLIFCDDDNWLDSNYLTVVAEIFSSHPSVGAVGGVGEAHADATLPQWFEEYKGCYACYPQADHEGVIATDAAFLYGAGLAVRKEVFLKLINTGFQPLLPDRVGTSLIAGGDTELCYAFRLLGYDLWYSDRLKFKHYLPKYRLTEDYLYRLISSMSYCSGLLIIYTYVLNDKKINRLTWIKDALYQIKFFIKSVAARIFSKDDLTNRLDYAFSLNRMKSIFHQTGTYRRSYRRILRLKSTYGQKG